MKLFLIIIAIIIILILAIYVNHRIRLIKEAKFLSPLGEIVQVDGNNLSVYTEGDGETTLIFMSGAGTSSPILDFKSLYSCLSDKYKIAVVEKFGYGFSDVVDKSRDIDSMLEDTIAALTAAGLNAPYVLCPHSMSGLEALYWAQKYPDEVSAIIGLDMAVPSYYENMQINLPLMRISSFAAKIGVTRLIPGISESDAIINGTLTDTEKEIYKAVFYSRTATVTMINECESVKANAKKFKIWAFRKFQCYCLFRTAPAEQGLTKKRGVEYRKSILLKLIMQSILNWTALIMFTTMNIKKLVKILFNFY